VRERENQRADTQIGDIKHEKNPISLQRGRQIRTQGKQID